MYVDIEKLNLVIRQFDENGEEVKDSSFLCDLVVKGSEVDNAFQFRISAVLSSEWEIPVRWKGDAVYDFAK